MLGLIPNLLLKLVEGSTDTATLADVKRRAGVPLERKYRINSICPDAEWKRLFSVSCETLNLTEKEGELAYADFFCRDAVKRWPKWFNAAANSRQFLELQPAIHNTFATLVLEPDTRLKITEKFHLEARDDNLIVHYRSTNQLCGLYTALAQWIIDYYGDTAHIDEVQCMKCGDEECEIHIKWGNDGANRDNRKL